MALDPLTAVADLAGTVINEIWPDKTEQEKAQLQAAIMVVQSQLDINKEEAKSPSIFVSGWRPFIGWVCGMACAWNWLGLSVAKFIAITFFAKTINLSAADISEMMPVLMGMLGLGAFRTVEKLNGKA